MDDLRARHEKEQQDLQSQITQKKKSATKKTRQGVNDDCAELERRLKERQAQDITDMGVLPSREGDPHPTNSIPDISIPLEEDELPTINAIHEAERPPEEDLVPERPPPKRKQNRQKARLARRAAEKEAAAAETAAEVPSAPSLRDQERAIMLKEFERYGLKEQEVRPDGHCLYSAVADQLTEAGLELEPKIATEEHPLVVNGNHSPLPDYRRVRKVAADYISAHPEDFLPFLEEPLDEYTHKVRDTGEWGGQLELLALARSYGIEINVLQGDGRVEKIEVDGIAAKDRIWLGYYRHHFGLGEHYNSLRKAS